MNSSRARRRAAWAWRKTMLDRACQSTHPIAPPPTSPDPLGPVASSGQVLDRLAEHARGDAQLAAAVTGLVNEYRQVLNEPADAVLRYLLTLTNTALTHREAAGAGLVLVRAARRSDQATVVATLTDAFANTPIAQWLATDPHQRRGVLTAHFTARVEHAFDHGFIDITPDGAGVAVWLAHIRPPRPTNPPSTGDAPDGVWSRRRVLDAVSAEHHPDTAHHCLDLLAVTPTAQGRGVGSALLDHQLSNLDARRVDAYLHATSTVSRDLFRRAGFSPNPPVPLPNEGPLVWPMRRTPYPRPAEATG